MTEKTKSETLYELTPQFGKLKDEVLFGEDQA